MNINKAAQLNKMYLKAIKESKKTLGLCSDRDDYLDLLRESIDNNMKLQLAQFNSAQKYLPELNKILEEHYPKEPEPTKLTDKWTSITIRPEVIINIHEFKHAVLQVLASPKYLEYEYVFEQKGESEDEIGIGAHCHILTKIQGYIKGRKEIIDTFGPLKNYKCQPQIGKKDGPMLFKDQIGLDRYRNYIRGNKHNKDKEAACAMDIIWRKKIGLQPIYFKEPSNQDH